MTLKPLAAIAVASLALGGCVAMPSSVLLEEDHMSSLTQHVRTEPTNYGISSSMVYLRWRPTPHTYIDLGEGISYSGALILHHPEVFQGRVGIELPLRAAP